MIGTYAVTIRRVSADRSGRRPVDSPIQWTVTPNNRAPPLNTINITNNCPTRLVRSSPNTAVNHGDAHNQRPGRSDGSRRQRGNSPETPIAKNTAKASGADARLALSMRAAFESIG